MPAVAAVVLAVAALAGCAPDDGSDADGSGDRPPMPPVAPPDGATVWFTEVGEAAGLDHRQGERYRPPDCLVDLAAPALGTDEDRRACEVEPMTGGAAVADYDGDGSLDVYLTRLEGPGVLYRNDGDGTFTDVTAAAGLDVLDVPSNGAAWGDFDHSGHPDLFVAGFGSTRAHLFMNNGDGTFREQALDRGAALDTGATHVGFSVTVGDFDGDGWLDIHANEWWPTGLTEQGASHTRLLRNLGAEGRPGHFEDVTEAAGLVGDQAVADVWAFASALRDLDGDGQQDLAIVGDFGTSRLFWNDGDGTFVEGTATARVGTDENGMGSTFGDYDNSGRLDWFVSSIFDTERSCDDGDCAWGYSGNRLFRNDGDRTFTDVTDEAGVRDGGWGWGAGFFDADNDGWLDLVMTNGIDYGDDAVGGHFAEYPKQLWMNDRAGGFEERAQDSGITTTAPGTGLVVFDSNNNGRLDVLMVQNGDRPLLYRNDSDTGHGWLRVRVEGRESNRDGVGAEVTLRATPTAPRQLRVVASTTEFLGQSERIAHFGLGAHDGPVHEVRVRWPVSGREVVLTDVEPDRLITVVEP